MQMQEGLRTIVDQVKGGRKGSIEARGTGKVIQGAAVFATSKTGIYRIATTPVAGRT